MMVRLQRQKAYTYEAESGEKINHYKHLVVIPEDALETLGWKHGIELVAAVEDDALVLKGKPKPNRGQK